MQVVGYEPGVDGPPALRLAADGTVRTDPLPPGTDLTYALGERHCAGAVADGVHEACAAESAPHCEAHTSTWPCARCRGQCDLPLESCAEEHAVYLAAFAPDTFKVGVTRSWRLERRLREQGADRAAHVHTVSNGRIARQIEADVATSLPDRVRTPTKMRSLATTVDEAAWTALLEEFEPIATVDFDYGLALDVRPIRATMATGRVRGAKGRLLVLERAGTTYAVDMRDLVGHEVASRAGDGDRQASLGSF